LARQRHVDLDGKGLPVALDEHVEHALGAPSAQRVDREVHHPRVVQLQWGVQRHDVALGQPFLGSVHTVEAKRPVHAVDALVISRMPERPKTNEALPEAPTLVLLDDGL
jgi:hypothetical protein